MRKLLQINSVLNYGSTGKIVEQIAQTAQSRGWESVVAHGVKYPHTTSQKEIIVGNKINLLYHEASSLLFDRHGLASTTATKMLVERIIQFNPDIIHLHNIHNYYLNYVVLFDFLASIKTPVIWTLHDCWPFTGHCSYFDIVGCDKWKIECCRCPGLSVYPRSAILDRSKRNFFDKKRCFTSVSNRLTIVPVSHWLEGFVRQSFLKDVSIYTIHNGIDIGVFRPIYSSLLRNRLRIGNKTVVLGVALPWSPRKGLADMFRLAECLPSDLFQIITVGLSEKQLRQCPRNIIGIERTNSVEELVELYSLASVFVNPTYEDNYPTTNLEAMACGTPVITYRTGGSPEAISPETGVVVEQGDVAGMVEAIRSICDKGKEHYTEACRKRAEEHFDKDKCFEKYVELYETLIQDYGLKVHGYQK